MSEQKTKAKGRKPSRAEIILAVIAVTVVVGWVFSWTDSGAVRGFNLFSDPFALFSFFGSLAVVAYVALQPFGLVSLPQNIDRKIVPVLSLLPVVGYLCSIVVPMYDFLTIGGSIALAYVSATAFWSKQMEYAGKKVAAGVQETLQGSKRGEAATEPVDDRTTAENEAENETEKDVQNSTVSST